MSNEEFIKGISLEGEDWRDVVGYEGLYKISSLGRCASFQFKKPRLLAPSINYARPKYKRYCISLVKNGIRKNAKLHQIVAQAFLQNPNGYTQVDHINGDTSDNRIVNLRFCDSKMNQNNPITRRNIAKALTGLPNPCKWVAVIRFAGDGTAKKYDNISEAAHEMKVCHAAIIKAIKRKHRCRGFQWMYLSDWETSISAMSKNSLESGGE